MEKKFLYLYLSTIALFLSPKIGATEVAKKPDDFLLAAKKIDALLPDATLPIPIRWPSDDLRERCKLFHEQRIYLSHAYANREQVYYIDAKCLHCPSSLHKILMVPVPATLTRAENQMLSLFSEWGKVIFMLTECIYCTKSPARYPPTIDSFEANINPIIRAKQSFFGKEGFTNPYDQANEPFDSMMCQLLHLEFVVFTNLINIIDLYEQGEEITNYDIAPIEELLQAFYFLPDIAQSFRTYCADFTANPEDFNSLILRKVLEAE